MKTKQVIIIRKDLNMRKGKMVSQGAHASLGAALIAKDVIIGDKELYDVSDLESWFEDGLSTKITCGVESLEELERIENEVKDTNIIYYKVVDVGLTEFKGIATVTALAIGPAPSKEIDLITGHLKLL